MTGKTSSGFEYDIDGKAIHDFRFLRAVRDMQSTDLARQVEGVTAMVEIIFNDPEQEERFLRHVAKDGRALTSDVIRETREILDSIKAQDETVKNF